MAHHLHSFPEQPFQEEVLFPGMDAGAHLGGRSLREKSGLKLFWPPEDPVGRSDLSHHGKDTLGTSLGLVQSLRLSPWAL